MEVKKKTITVNLPRNLIKDCKEAAQQEEKTLNEWVNDVIKQWIAEHEDEFTDH